LDGGYNKNKIGLVILDGWGIAPAWGGNAIAQANTKYFNKIWRSYPSTTLLASGSAVGLPTNAPGNSEAGHLNIGAGKVVHQDVTFIDLQMENGQFKANPKIQQAVDHVLKNQSNLHLMGMLSKAGTHSHLKHLYSLLELLKSKNVRQAYIHLFTDGRDSDPYSGIELVSEVENKILEIGLGQIVSIIGRYFVMDRDNRWGRIARAYNLLVKGEGNAFPSAKKAISDAYSKGQSDEFIEPRLIRNSTSNPVLINNDDSLIIFNFRSDRTKEILSAFLSPKIKEFPDRKKINNLFCASFVIYDEENLAVPVFDPEIIAKPIASVISDHKYWQIHIAETEKYPHVTYFINGGREKPYPGEKRIMIPSQRSVKTYDYKPKMSAKEITVNLVQSIKMKKFNFIIVNYANPDMVGHTGNFESTKNAVSYTDECLGVIVPEFLKQDYAVFIVGDHGNAEQMINPRTGNPDTEHTTNPVPFCLVSSDTKLNKIKFLSSGILANVAPTILEIMGLEKPDDMLSSSIIINES